MPFYPQKGRMRVDFYHRLQNFQGLPYQKDTPLAVRLIRIALPDRQAELLLCWMRKATLLKTSPIYMPCDGSRKCALVCSKVTWDWITSQATRFCR